MPFIALVGYRGTGKTTLGRRVAEVLGWRFVDADEALERRYGTTVREVFAAEGEAGFRDKESAVLRDLCAAFDTVIATGGGCVLREENRRLLRQGFVVWLTAEPETIDRRLRGDPTTADRRPDLTTGGLGEIRHLLAERGPLYRGLADFAIATDDLSPDMLAASILRAWTSSRSSSTTAT